MKVSVAARLLQDRAFPPTLRDAQRILVVVVPEDEAINGGVLSLFWLAAELRRQKPIHSRELVIMTRPQNAPITHFHNTKFANAENVYRFSQLMLCSKADDILILLPEYSSGNFYKALSAGERALLSSTKNLRIHILNQNVDLMPPPRTRADLYRLTNDVTQSVAHHVHATQKRADLDQLPTLLLPAFTDVSGYPSRLFAEKEKLIIYSPDRASWKQRCLAAVSSALPDYELREIRDICFDDFMDLAARCMFSITFGEGFDGYFAQPMQMGGIGFGIYNDRFFPLPNLAKRANVFTDSADMIARIGAIMRELSLDETKYTALNFEWKATIDALYDHDDYRRRVSNLALGQFDFFPAPPS